MTRCLLPLVVLLTIGCHSRFKKAAASIDAVAVEVVVLSGPTVTLPQSQDTGIVGAVMDITQAVRAGNIAGHLASKVDPQGVNQAFVDGFAGQLGEGPPFAWRDDAPHLLRYELVSWGMENHSFFTPGVYTYQLRVRGIAPDGSTFYKSGVSCATDAGAGGWVEMSPFGPGASPDKIKNMPPERIQRIFDATAADCARTALYRLQQHARP